MISTFNQHFPQKAFPVCSDYHRAVWISHLGSPVPITLLWSVTQLCPTLFDSIDCSMPGFPVLPHLTLMFIESVMPSNHLILCHPLLLLLSIFPSIRVFSRESALHIREPKFNSVQFSRSVVSDSFRPHESQHARPPCPSPSPGVHSDSCPSSP